VDEEAVREIDELRQQLEETIERVARLEEINDRIAYQAAHTVVLHREGCRCGNCP
jgi:uncharacterized protein (UPF0335 family)